MDQNLEQFFIALWSDLLERWPLAELLVARETTRLATGAEAPDHCRILLVRDGEQAVAIGHAGADPRQLLTPSRGLLGLPGCWHGLPGRRKQAELCGISFEQERPHFTYQPRRGQQLAFRCRHPLPAAGRHFIAGLRDCGPRPLDDVVLLSVLRALCQLSLEHLRSDRSAADKSALARWRRMRLYLQERCHEALSRSEVARRFGVNPATCSVLARRFENHSFNEVLVDFRLQRARELLRQGGVSIHEVALRSGFASSSYFARRWRRRFGISPGEWQIRAGTVNATGPHEHRQQDPDVQGGPAHNPRVRL